MLGISIKPTIGIGDGLQFTSLPENYFRSTGKKLIDVNRPWFFDHNPFVDRESEPSQIRELWNFSPKQFDWPEPKRSGAKVYVSNAEIWAEAFGVPAVLNRPRLYQFEDYPFEKRDLILLHPEGISHGTMPDHVIEHVVKKYGPTGKLRQIGKDNIKTGIPKIETENLWELAEVISRARMIIGIDSSPCWIAACYPDVIIKVVRTKPQPDQLKSWIPLEIGHIHSYWDDRCRMIFNPSDNDCGFTWSYRRI